MKKIKLTISILLFNTHKPGNGPPENDTINRKRMPTRVCAACDAHSLPRVGGVHVCPALLFLHSCGRSAEGGGGAGRAEHNAAKEAIHLNTLNPEKTTTIAADRFPSAAGERLPLRQTHNTLTPTRAGSVASPLAQSQQPAGR